MNRLRPFRPSHLVAPTLLAGVALAAFNNPFTPPFRGQPDTEFAGWEDFTVAFGGPNAPDDAQTTADDAVITQTTPGAILTSTNNIYNPAGASHFVLTDSVPQDIQEIVLQTATLGTPPDLGSFVLSFVGSGGTVMLPPSSTQNLWNAGGSLEYRFDWDLSGIADTITSYTIEFDASGAHMSLDSVLLDTRFDDGGNDIGTNYCQANNNSTGVPGRISAQGSTLVADNDVTLTASDLPLNKNGYFINAPAQDFIPNPGGSQGNLCLGGGVGRHRAQTGNSGMLGTISAQIDIDALPRPAGMTVAVMSGETWYWQLWYRDQNPGQTSNFTDGICITFQ